MRVTNDLTDTRVAIYARFSSERQRESSIDDQVERCRAYIARAGGDLGRVQVFSDHARSGASLDRPGFEQLMSAVDAGEIDAIVTEDLSRISRDIADSAEVFKRLQFAQVPLIGVADGIDTSSRNAKLSYTIKSLVADIYLDDLRDKTRRGLEGRARAGYATGQMPYGFRSVSDGHGQRIEIDEQKAIIVRRVFMMYRDGKSLSAIARTLTSDGIPSPRSGTRHKNASWGPSTIRTMLYNERYIGVWTYNQTEWVRLPGSSKRRPRQREESEVMRFERPHLRIIEPELWEQVRTRLGMQYRKYTRNRSGRAATAKTGHRHSRYLFSGLLRCNRCDAPMTIMSGSSATYYRCSAQRKLGTCDSARSVREERIRGSILGQLRRQLKTPEAMAYVRQRIIKRLGERGPRCQAKLDQHRQRLKDTRARIKSLVGYLAEGESTYVKSALRDLEAQAKAQKAMITTLRRQSEQPIPLPDVGRITAKVFELDGLLRDDVQQGREYLRRLLGDSLKIVMKDDGCEVHAPTLGVIALPE